MLILSWLLLSSVSHVYGLAVKQSSTLLVTSNEAFFDDCGAQYLGTYNSREPLSIYTLPETCHSFGSLNSGSIIPFEDIPPRSSLVWVEEVVAEGPLRDQPTFSESLETFMNPEPSRDGQTILDMQSRPQIQVLWSNQHGAILSLLTEDLGILDFSLPRLWEAIVLPSTEVPPPHATESDSDKRLGEILSKVHFNPDVASILSSLSVAQMFYDIRWLTGEASDSPLTSRHSFSDGARVAAEWLKSKFQEFGAECSYMEFQEGFAPNVICRYAAGSGVNEARNTTAPRVILSAHYDSRGTFGR